MVVSHVLSESTGPNRSDPKTTLVKLYSSNLVHCLAAVSSSGTITVLTQQLKELSLL